MTESTKRILIFEWLSGGGLWLDRSIAADVLDLQHQGQQMLSELCEDFSDAGLQVVTPIDSRCNFDVPADRIIIGSSDSVNLVLEDLAYSVDWILVVAPESNGCLSRCRRWFTQHEHKLLNPGIEFTDLASDKNLLQDLMHKQNVPIPDGYPAASWIRRCSDKNDLSAQRQIQKWIFKPSDGCGGEGVQLFVADGSFAIESRNLSQWRIEEFVPGIPVSVSVVMHRAEPYFYPALRQVFHDNPVGKFSHCVNDLPISVANRASQLAQQTIAAMPGSRGFAGIDCIIGDRDVVVEVNPRITMSYGILRSEFGINIAEHMIESCRSGC